MNMRTVLDSKKLAALGTVNEDLDARYGKIGIRERDEFDAKAKAWYMAECLRDARKASGMTQQQLADRIGKKRTCISLIERGQTDMQLSAFIQISEAVGLNFSLVYA
ncbi:MAG: helix-turn-helix transcriptional regulator [Bacteroidales bacterium]|nr:helix-turn-helix transcriptional regulator [Bacteroidales bacterium]